MTDLTALASIIEQAFDDRANITPTTVSSEIKTAVLDSLAALNNGSARVAEKIDGQWHVHQWLKKSGIIIISYLG